MAETKEIIHEILELPENCFKKELFNGFAATEPICSDTEKLSEPISTGNVINFYQELCSIEPSKICVNNDSITSYNTQCSSDVNNDMLGWGERLRRRCKTSYEELDCIEFDDCLIQFEDYQNKVKKLIKDDSYYYPTNPIEKIVKKKLKSNNIPQINPTLLKNIKKGPKPKFVESCCYDSYDCNMLTCKVSFRTEADVKYHVRCHNSDKSNFICPECSLEFISWLEVKSHLREVHIIDIDALKEDVVLPPDTSLAKIHSCPYCEYKTISKWRMTEHKRLHTGEKPYKCDQCNFITGRKKSLQQHKMTHTGEKQYLCPFCSYAAIKSSNYKIHLLSKHPEKKCWFECKDCNYSTIQEAHYKRHMEMHERGIKPMAWLKRAETHKCDYCNYVAPHKHILKEHERQHTGEKPFECDQCDYKTGRRKLLKFHMMTHTQEKQYKCPYCSYSAIRAHNFKFHLRKKHPDKKYLYECRLCTYTSINVNHFEKHMEGHERGTIQATDKIDRSRCDICNYLAKDRYSLDEHIRQHTGEKPYQCEYCDYVTGRKRLLKLHQMRHSEEWYTCPHCPYRYAIYSTTAYKDHVKNKHSEKECIFKCDMCSYSCTDDKEFREHAEIHKREELTNVELAETQMEIKSFEKFICKICAYTSPRKTHLNRHMNLHNDEKSKSETFDQQFIDPPLEIVTVLQKSKGKLYKCLYCSYLTVFVKSYKRHLERRHLGKICAYLCGLCLFSSPDHKDFLEHEHKNNICSKDSTNISCEEESLKSSVHSENLESFIKTHTVNKIATNKESVDQLSDSEKKAEGNGDKQIVTCQIYTELSNSENLSQRNPEESTNDQTFYDHNDGINSVTSLSHSDSSDTSTTITDPINSTQAFCLRIGSPKLIKDTLTSDDGTSDQSLFKAVQVCSSNYSRYIGGIEDEQSIPGVSTKPVFETIQISSSNVGCRYINMKNVSEPFLNESHIMDYNETGEHQNINSESNNRLGNEFMDTTFTEIPSTINHFNDESDIFKLVVVKQEKD